MWLLSLPDLARQTLLSSLFKLQTAAEGRDGVEMEEELCRQELPSRLYLMAGGHLWPCCLRSSGAGGEKGLCASKVPSKRINAAFKKYIGKLTEITAKEQ